MEQKSVNIHVSKNKHSCIVTSKEDGQILNLWVFFSEVSSTIGIFIALLETR